MFTNFCTLVLKNQNAEKLLQLKEENTTSGTAESTAFVLFHA